MTDSSSVAGLGASLGPCSCIGQVLVVFRKSEEAPKLPCGAGNVAIVLNASNTILSFDVMFSISKVALYVKKLM